MSAAAEEKAMLDLGIFSAIMSYWNVDEIDSSAIVDKMDTSQQKIAAMVYSARNTPRAYLALVEAGAAPGQIPPWITRPTPPGARPVISPVAPLETPETPPEQPMPPAEPVETLPLEPESQIPPGTLRAPGEGAFEALPGVNAGARLGGIYDGVRLQSERLNQLGIIRDQGGRYLKATTNPDGSPGFVEVDPVEVERGLIKDVGTKISEAAVGDLNIHMRTVVRKIGLNPTVFMSYAWVVSEKGYNGDLGDFCIQANKYLMKSRGRLIVTLVINGTIYRVRVNPNSNSSDPVDEYIGQILYLHGEYLRVSGTSLPSRAV